ncbi:MAG: hypothetical protein LBN31_07805 [Hungatella sp.]|jgi:hypothetical protein|uniref:hypothetical protein n=1 Tax=Clostridium sp. NkU-1 TaxID=1095009 RepID=UPI0006D057A7|nr:hypothetical protein [Hungatella sp.]
MEEKRKRVTKKMACEIAALVIGTRKMDKQDDIGYYFSTGSITLRVIDRCIIPKRSTFSRFHLNGELYEGQALDCTIFVGGYVNHDLFYTLEGHQEIDYEYAEE